jgi:Spy/CpxP family protein refolding chaperone
MSNNTELPNPEPKSRRTFLKRTAIVMLLAGIAAGVGVKAFAFAGVGGWGCAGFTTGGLSRATAEAHLDRMLRHIYIEIDTTEEQQGRLGPIVKQAAQDLLSLREKMREGRGKVIDVLTQDGVDRDKIENVRAEQLGLAEQASRRIAQVLADTAEVLTPTQRKELAARIERHQRGWR